LARRGSLPSGLELGSGGHSDQLAFWRGHDRPPQLFLRERFRDRGRSLVWADRGRAGLHYILDTRVGVAVAFAAREPAENYAPLADDDRERVARVRDALVHSVDRVGQRTGDDVIADQRTDRRDFGVLALNWQPVREPVSLPRLVVVDLGEAERFEPARGSWAQVSERVPAVHDHWPSPIQHGGALSCQLLEREADRVGKVAVAVVLFGERLDELCSRSDQALNIGPIDRRGHRFSARVRSHSRNQRNRSRRWTGQMVWATRAATAIM